MNVKSIAILSLVLAATLAAPAGAQQPDQPFKSEKELRSYALGMDLGNQLRKLSVDVDPAVLARGLRDGLAGNDKLMTEDDVKVVIARMQAEIKAKQIQAMSAPSDPKKAEENKKAGDAFLLENKKKPGVVTLPSGLQYKILTVGTGRRPTATDTVVCQYRGTLIDGTEFDSSYSRGQAAAFPVNAVIPGWTEALQLMPVGSKWQLFIPSELAYSTRGFRDKIGPNATLVFEIELLSIK